jgi:aspartate 1-decarboxylase
MEFLNGQEPHFNPNALNPTFAIETNDPLAAKHQQQDSALFVIDESLNPNTVTATDRWQVEGTGELVSEEFRLTTPPAVDWRTLFPNVRADLTLCPNSNSDSLWQDWGKGEPSKLSLLTVPLSPTQTTPLSPVKQALDSIQKFFDRSDYLTQLQLAYGNDLTAATVTSALTQIRSLPQLEILPAATLGIADGAFDGLNNKIYLSTNLIERNDTTEIAGVIIEEIGHYLDRQFHGNLDAPGDEGEIFAKLVRNIPISETQYRDLLQEDDWAQITLNGQTLDIERAVATGTYALRAHGTVTFKGASDLDGNPLDLSDDAFIYAEKGFTFNGKMTLPVQRDASGNALTNAQGQELLLDKAVVVTAGASVNVSNGNKFTNLNPPQVVDKLAFTIPTLNDVKQQELTRRIPTGTPTTTFNISTNPINNTTQWTQKFPPAGTASLPTVVRVTGGGLNIPSGVNLSNYVIIVDSGDLNFNGSGTIDNVMLIASGGNVNLNGAQATNLTVLASGTITENNSARFSGYSVLANGTGDIIFNGATKTIAATDNLRVVSAGAITFNGAQVTRGSFASKGNFTTNGSSNIYGTITTAGNITFNGSSTFTYANILDLSDTIPPAITARLATDTGSSNTDRITFDPTINGTVLDASQVTTFRASFEGTSFVTILPTRQADGSFSLSRTQLDTIAGRTLTDGNYTLNLTASDEFGNASASFSLAFTLDTTIVTPTNLQLATTSDTGVSNSDRITKINTPTITGNGNPGDTIELKEGSTILGTATVASTGIWSIASSSLTNGSHSLTAIASDIAGNISGAATALNITIDAVVPQLTLTAPIDTVPLQNNAKLIGSITSGSQGNDPTVSGLVGIIYNWDNSSNLLQISPDASGNFNKSLDFTGINNGAHTLTITASDVAGNISTNTYNVNVALDKDAPLVELRLVNDTGTNNSDRLTNNPTITGKVTDASSLNSIKVSFTAELTNSQDLTASLLPDGSFNLERTLLTQLNGGSLGDGNYTLYLQAADIYGNTTAPQSLNFTLDNTAPLLQLERELTGIVLNNSSYLKGQLTDSHLATLSYQFDGASPIAVVPNASGNFDAAFDFTGINDGAHNLTLTASDNAGNRIERTYGVTLARGALLTIALLNDTGASNTDGITSDINVRGQVADRRQISRLEFTLDGNPNYADLTVTLQLDGTFRLSPLQLNSLAGGTLAFGTHSLAVRGVLADGTPVSTATLDFIVPISRVLASL